MNEKIMLQISSGQGPDECELGVGKLYDALCEEFESIELISKTPGRKSGCYCSIRFIASNELKYLEGSVLWTCQSPLRPHHKRKNWYIDISICSSSEIISFDEKLIQFETFRSSGKGGQHVNKTESGVRAIYTPTGDSVIATDERSQHRNRQIAVQRLGRQIEKRNALKQACDVGQNRLENYRIIRGNPVRVYEGPEFKRKR